jgi:Lhr-like helicase
VEGAAGAGVRLAEGAERKSILPKADQLLVETFPRGARFYLVAYPFEGGSPTRRSACC